MDRFVAIAVAVAAVGCSSEVQQIGGSAPEGGGGTAPIGAGPVGGSSDGGAAQGGENAGGSGGAPPMFDCATAPTGAISVEGLPGLRGYHGLALDTDGSLFGLDTNWTLGRGSYAGDWQPYVANMFVEQMEFGASGDLFLGGGEGVIGITPAAQPYTVNAEVGSVYGLRVGPDQQIYAVDSEGVRRIDPVSGVAESVVTLPNFSGHSFDFSPALDRLYIGTIGEGILQVALDRDLVAAGRVEPFAPLDGFPWIDGVATDACGTVYAVNYDTKQLLRITPAGELSVYAQFSESEYPHGLIFGNGVGGFREDALYLPQPYNGNTVVEVVVGVPSRAAGLVLDGP
jgi:hypothetical protein